MAAKKALATGIKEIRIVLCPTGKSSEGVRSFLKKDLPEVKKKLPKVNIMVRECKGSYPAMYVRMGSGPEQKYTLANLPPKSIMTQVATLLPQEVPATIGKPGPTKEARFRLRPIPINPLNPFRKNDKPAEDPNPLFARQGPLRNKSLRARFIAARKAALAKNSGTFREKRSATGTVECKCGQTEGHNGTKPACNAFWDDGAKGPTTWPKEKVNGDTAKYGGTTQSAAGLPDPACNLLWETKGGTVQSWARKEPKAPKFKYPVSGKVFYGEPLGAKKTSGRGGKADVANLPEPACNKFADQKESGYAEVAKAASGEGKAVEAEAESGSFFSRIKSFFGKVMKGPETVANEAQAALNKVLDAPGQIVSGAKEQAKSAVESVMNAPKAVVSEAKDLANKVAEMPGTIASEVQDQAKNVVDSVMNAPKAVVSEAKDLANKVAEMPGAIASEVTEQAKNVVETVKNAPGAVVAEAKDLANKVAEVPGAVVSEVADSATKVVDKIKEGPGAVVTDVTNQAKEVVEKIKDKDAMGAVIETSKLVDKLTKPENLIPGVSEAKTQLDKVFDQVTKPVEGIPGAKSAIKMAFGKFGLTDAVKELQKLIQLFRKK